MENDLKLESKIEGILFYKGEEVEISEIAKILNKDIEEINIALDSLDKSLEGRGLVLVRRDKKVILGIHSLLGQTIENLRKDEFSKDLSKASLDTFSIVLYQNGISRSEIDYIRGVNSSFILRNLLVRGLIERYIDPKDSRKMLYRPSFQALSLLGINSIDKLPNYEKIKGQLEEVYLNKQKNENE